MEGDLVHFSPLNNRNSSKKDMLIRSGGIEGTGHSGIGTIKSGWLLGVKCSRVKLEVQWRQERNVDFEGCT